MKRRTIVFLVSSILAIILSANYWFSLSTTPVKQTAPLLSSADYFFKNVFIKQFDDKGRLINQLEAGKLEHFKNLQQSQTTSPRIQVQNSELSSWSIEAKNGYINHNTDQIRLVDSVVIKLSKVDESSVLSQTRIKTQQLIFGLDNNSAYSDEKVTITNPESITNAQAMSANFNTTKIKLSGQVQTTGLTDEPHNPD